MKKILTDISLTADEVIELIFEKKIIYGHSHISMKDSSLCMLSKLEDQLKKIRILGKSNYLIKRKRAK